MNFKNYYNYISIVCTPPLLSAGGLNSLPNFQKGERGWQDQFLGRLQFLHKK